MVLAVGGEVTKSRKLLDIKINCPMITLCTRDTINYLTSETDTTRRGAWLKMESGELTIILILQVFMRGSLGQELAEK